MLVDADDGDDDHDDGSNNDDDDNDGKIDGDQCRGSCWVMIHEDAH